jgi:hypothetical protein
MEVITFEYSCLIMSVRIYPFVKSHRRAIANKMKIADWLPLMGIVSGVFALYVDPKQSPKWRGIAIAGILLVAFASVGASYHDDRADKISQDSKERQYKQDMEELNGHIETLTLLVLQNNGVREPASAASDPKETSLILAATKARQQVVANLPALSASSLAIQYFPHFTSDVNPKVVRSALEQIGASVSEKQGNSSISDLPTNCIWIGDRVTPDEARAVALTLVAAGVPLRDIRSLQNPSGGNARLVEIGSSANVVNMPALSSQDLLNRPIPSKPSS